MGHYTQAQGILVRVACGSYTQAQGMKRTGSECSRSLHVLLCLSAMGQSCEYALTRHIEQDALCSAFV